MNINLNQWLTLEIQHQYFENELCPVFDLVPMRSTQRLMKNYNIRIQKNKNRYIGYVNVRPSKSIWEELEMNEDFYFQMINSDPEFDNYTDVPLVRKEESVLYLTNSQIANRSHEEEYITPNTFVQVQALRFSVTVQSDPLVSVVVKNNVGDEVFNQIADKNQSSVFIDISVFGNGIYEIWVDGKRTKIFFGTSEKIEDQCYGIFHLQMKKVTESLKENTTPILKVGFQARATYWRYAIVISEDKNITIQDMTLLGVNKEQYSGPTIENIIGGKESNVFTSTKVLKLHQKMKETPMLKIIYNNDFSDTVLELDMKMPIPKVSSIITKKENNENLLYSQTIIYV